MGERYRVTRIVVKQGGRLLLNCHRVGAWGRIRAPHQSRSATPCKMLHENKSVYVPSGSQHLENPGKIDLELIEVQNGTKKPTRRAGHRRRDHRM